MALITTNSTISGGSCASYGGTASGVKRSCSDCLHYAITSEPQGCIFTANSGCVARTASQYCSAGDPACYACLNTWLNKDDCQGLYGCVCLQSCGPTTSYSSSTNSPSSSDIQSSFDDAAAKMDSDFNHTRNIFIGCAVGMVTLIVLCAIVSNCRRRRTHQQYYQGTGTGDRIWRSDGPTHLDASSPGMGCHFGHETTVVAGTAYDDSSTNFNFTSDVPFAQAVDYTPSAPTYDNSSMSAPATSTATSSYD